MKSFDDKVAAITGAASGIGRAPALRLGRRNCHLALSDVDEAGLKETVDQVSGLGVRVTAQRVDVANREKFEKTFITSADKAADEILEGVRRNQRRILVGPDARVFDWVVRLLPATYQRIAVGYSRFSAK